MIINSFQLFIIDNVYKKYLKVKKAHNIFLSSSLFSLQYNICAVSYSYRFASFNSGHCCSAVEGASDQRGVSEKTSTY